MTSNSARRDGATPRAPRDPYGIGPVSGLVGPAIAVVALVVIGVLTLNLLNGQLPISVGNGGGGGTGNGNGGGGPQVTAAPSNVVIVEPDISFKGTIAYAKAGNIWVQDATSAHQLTDSGNDSMPAFSSDGRWIYFIRVTPGRGKFPGGGGGPSYYDLFTPSLMRVQPDGSNIQKLLTGKYQLGSNTWFTWMREPTPSPDGKSVVLVTDGPNPTTSDIVLKRFDLGSKQLTSLRLPESDGLGHQDPAWRADDAFLAYVKNQRDGSKGAPQIYRYDPAANKTVPLTGPGYIGPSWSPDGQFLAATRTDTFGTDVVILDSRGKEVLRVTDDQDSFSPVWSPAGDAIAYLNLDGTIVDLKLAQVDNSTGKWTVTKTLDLTKVSGLDATSRPTWFIPPDQLPAPSTTPPAASTPPASAPSATVSSAP
jgi:Tol biopolymer transport system component